MNSMPNNSASRHSMDERRLLIRCKARPLLVHRSDGMSLPTIPLSVSPSFACQFLYHHVTLPPVVIRLARSPQQSGAPTAKAIAKP